MSLGQRPRGATGVGAAGWATPPRAGSARGAERSAGTARPGHAGRTRWTSARTDAAGRRARPSRWRWSGPTQSGKTTALAVPAILGWHGPVLAASVKTDLVARHRGLATALRPGVVLRPLGGHRPARPAGGRPLPACATWSGARRVAADLTEVAHGPGTTADGEFWYATAAKLLAPLLFAAARAVATWPTWSAGSTPRRWTRSSTSSRPPAWPRRSRRPGPRGSATTASAARSTRRPRPCSSRSPSRRGRPPCAASDVAGAAVHRRGRTRRPSSTGRTRSICAPRPTTSAGCAPLFVALVKQVLEAAFDRAARLAARSTLRSWWSSTRRPTSRRWPSSTAWRPRAPATASSW